MKSATLLLSVCSLAIVGGVGFLLGSGRIDAYLQPFLQPLLADPAAPAAAGTGPVIYYRHPDGEPAYSAVPTKTADGRDFVPVRASEDISFDDRAKTAETQDQSSSGERKILHYRNPMGLPDISKVPKKDSMGMDYIAVYEGDANDGSTVKVSLGKLQRTGVKTAEATTERLTQTLRVPGTVVLDERRIHVVSMRTDAFIEEVADVTTGSLVRAGETLFRFYSRDIATAASEVANMSARGNEDGSTLRLRNLGLSESMIELIRRDRKVPSQMSFDAPSDGIVIERMAISGMMAEPGDILFRIADTSEVWVVADVPENQLSAVSVGAEVSVTTRSAPGRSFAGTVAVVYPQIEGQTRTAKVRIQMPNPEGILLANMYADVEISAGPQRAVVAVPNNAIVDTGRRQMVFVDKGDGRFEPREVKIGMRGSDRTEIREGLKAGERIVVAANFLLDAESNLNSALNALAIGDEQQ